MMADSKDERTREQFSQSLARQVADFYGDNPTLGIATLLGLVAGIADAANIPPEHVIDFMRQSMRDVKVGRRMDRST